MVKSRRSAALDARGIDLFENVITGLTTFLATNDASQRRAANFERRLSLRLFQLRTQHGRSSLLPNYSLDEEHSMLLDNSPLTWNRNFIPDGERSVRVTAYHSPEGRADVLLLLRG